MAIAIAMKRGLCGGVRAFSLVACVHGKRHPISGLPNRSFFGISGRKKRHPPVERTPIGRIGRVERGAVTREVVPLVEFFAHGRPYGPR